MYRRAERHCCYWLTGASVPLPKLHATYYRRKREDSYPDAEELRVIARHFDLNPVDLMVRFGLVIAAEAGWGGGSPLATATKTKRQAEQRNVVPRVDLNGPSL
jgi:hypothetical protein